MNKRKSNIEFVQSDIESIPKGWEIKRIKHLGNLFGGLSGKKGDDFSSELNDKSKPYIPFKNIANNFSINPNQLDFVQINEDEQQNNILNGDLLFLMSSENYDDIGKSSVLNVDLGEVYLNSFCRGLRLKNTDETNPLFLNYLLHGDNYRKAIAIEAKGFTRINLQTSKLNDLKVLIPPIQEQTKIVEYLNYHTSRIDMLIAQKEALIRKLEEYRKSLINEAVTKGLNPDAPMKDSGVEWLGEIPEDWEVCKLKHVVNMQSGNFIQATEIDVEGVYPVYGGNGIRGFTQKFNLDGNYVLIGRQGALCGNINFASSKFWATEHAIVVYPLKETDLLYLKELLRIMNLNQYSESAAQPGLSVTKILNIKIPKITLKEQRQISDFLIRKEAPIISIINKIKTQLNLLQSYRQSLVSEAVTGKIDVREWQP